MKPALELPNDVVDELISSLRYSVEFGVPELFIETASWAQSTLIFRDHSPWELARALEALTFQLSDHIAQADEPAARETVRRAREELNIVRLIETPLIDETTTNGAIARKYLDALLNGDDNRAGRELLLAIATGQRTLDIYQRVLAPVMQEVGRLWQRNEITAAHEHIITNATERIMSQLMDLSPPRTQRDLCAITVAAGNAAHQLGARMVSDAFSLCGWQVSFLGREVPVSDILRFIEGVSVDVVACSAMRSCDIAPIRELIEAFETKPIAPIVIVGGRAFDAHPELWRKIGADGYSATPLMAVALASELISDCGD